MGILDNIINKPIGGPPKGIVYGPPGVGKTTFACSAPNHILLDIEQGANHLQCTKTPYLRTYGEVLAYLDALATDQHQYKVVALDTIDWLVRHIENDILQSDSKGAPTLNQAHGGYGAGRDMRRQRIVNQILPRLDTLVANGVAVILLAHRSRLKLTGLDGYDVMMNAPNVPQDVMDIFVEWSDFVGYAYKQDYDRFMRCVGTNEIVAKNRYGFPEQIALDWNEFANNVRKHNNSNKKDDTNV